MSNLPRTNQQTSSGAWQKEFEKSIAAAVLPKLQNETSPTRKAQILKDLVEKLRGFVDYDNYDPRQLNEFTQKQDYKCADKLIGHEASVIWIQALPDGRIVSGSDDNSICIWDGSEELEQDLASNVSAPADNGGQL